MLKDLLLKISKNPISLFGVWITTVSAVIFMSLFGIEFVGFSGGPYIGIMAFLVVPAFFVGGLLLIPFGIWWRRRKADAGPPLSAGFSVLVISLSATTGSRWPSPFRQQCRHGSAGSQW